ncbi:hypothetical protein IMY05_005G0159800 [Salix suchowensis]|nr:hypothetical protein IMY05_005G0159800 [Salix suchowensis]
MPTGQFRSRATKGLRVHVKAGFADRPTSLSLSLSLSLYIYIYIYPIPSTSLHNPVQLVTSTQRVNQTPTLLSLSQSSFLSLYPSRLSIIYKAKIMKIILNLFSRKIFIVYIGGIINYIP